MLVSGFNVTLRFFGKRAIAHFVRLSLLAANVDGFHPWINRCVDCVGA